MPPTLTSKPPGGTCVCQHWNKKMNAIPLLTQIRSFNKDARLFLLATFLNGITITTWLLFLNLFLLEWGFDKEFMGQVNAAPALAALLLSIPCGLLADRLGLKRSMLLGVSVMVMTMGLELIIRQKAVILVMAFLAGAANGLYFISQLPYIAQISGPENRAMLFSLNYALTPLAGVLGNALAGQLPSLFGRMLGVPGRSAPAYQAVLLLSVALGALSLAPLFLLRNPSQAVKAEAAPRPGSSFWEILRRPVTLRLSLPNLLVSLGAGLLIPYLNVFFVERFAVSDQLLGGVFSLSSLLTGGGVVLAPKISAVLGGMVSAIVATQAGGIFSLLLMGFIPSLGIATGGFLMRSVLMNMAVPLYDAFAMEQVHAKEQATVNSIMNVAWNTGYAVGPYLSGFIQEIAGFAPLFIATALLYAAATGMVWIFFHAVHPAEARRGTPVSG